jgi:hypothetical protein
MYTLCPPTLHGTRPAKHEYFFISNDLLIGPENIKAQKLSHI